MKDVKKLLPRDRLQAYGISLKANRLALFHKTKSAKYNQKNVCKDICSEKSYINIEKGNVARDLNVYVELAERLGKKAVYYTVLEKRMKDCFKKLYIAVEYCNFKEITNETNKLLELFLGTKHDLFYCDIFHTLKAIKNYYVKYKYIETQSIEYYIQILNILPIELKDILLFILFKTAYDMLEVKEFYEVCDKLNISQSTYICNKINLLSYYFANDETSNVLSYIKELEIECNSTNNIVRLMDIYQYALSYSSCFDSTNVKYYVNALEEIINYKNLEQKKRAEGYFTLALANYELGNYKEALDLFCTSDNEDINGLNFQFIFIAACQRKLDLPIKIKKYSNDELEKFTDDVKCIYFYYNMEEEPHFIRQKYLMDKVLPSIQNKDEIIVRIMKEELTSLTSYTSIYKDLMLYNMKEMELLNKK